MKKEYVKPQIEEFKVNIEAPLLVLSEAEEYDGPTNDPFDTEDH